MAEIHEQLAAAAAEVARLARGIAPGQFDDPTPCAEFRIAALCAHLMQEIVLHGWDLAVASGQTPRFSDEVAGTVLRWLEAENDLLRKDNWYSEPIATDSPSMLERAVARSGRDPHWTHHRAG
jgi:hypothetical protein